MNDIFLSLVLTGRNDDYGVGFNTRLFRTLRFNRRVLADSGAAHEILFIEWAPPTGRPLLADLVLEEVPEVGPVFRTWIVDARYQDALSLNPRLEYLEFPAKNVGIRRARGRFVLVTNCDVYLGRHVIERLAAGDLHPRSVFRAPRRDLKVGLDHVDLTWEALEDARNLAIREVRLHPPLYAGGTGDFVLLDRESFHLVRGFNEVYRLVRIGIDHNFLVRALSAGLEIEDIGGPVYHINHPGSYRETRRLFEGREAEAPYGDDRWPSDGVIYVNPDTWGLGAAPERAIGSQRWCLDFSWTAVPRLVDLRRLVLPAARTGRPQVGRLWRDVEVRTVTAPDDESK